MKKKPLGIYITLFYATFPLQQPISTILRRDDTNFVEEKHRTASGIYENNFDMFSTQELNLRNMIFNIHFFNFRINKFDETKYLKLKEIWGTYYKIKANFLSLYTKVYYTQNHTADGIGVKTVAHTTIAHRQEHNVNMSF